MCIIKKKHCVNIWGNKGNFMKLFKNTKMDLTEGSITKNLIIFSLPILLGTIVTQFYNIADSIVVGKLISSDALAAVSASMPVMTIINMFMIGLSSGSNVVIAQKMGSKRIDDLQKAFNTIAFLTVASSVFVTVVGLLISRPLLTLLDTPAEIFHDSNRYLMVIFIGTFGNLAYNMGSGALRGMGDSVWPFVFLVFCSVLNVVLAIIAVGVLHWGVMGSAIATAFSQLVSAIGIIYRINRGGYGIKLGWKNLKFDITEGKLIAAIGLPAGIQNIGNAFAALFVQKYANSFGPTLISANSVVTKIENLADIPVVALSTALCTFVGQNIGLLKMDRIKKGINGSMAVLVGFGSLMCALMIALRHLLPRIFVNDAEVIAMAGQGLTVLAFVSVFTGIDRCLVNAMRGAGKSVVPMITAQFGAFSRIPLAYFLAVRTGSYMGIFYALLLASLLRMLAIAFYYFGGGWRKAVKGFLAKHEREEAERAESVQYSAHNS